MYHLPDHTRWQIVVLSQQGRTAASIARALKVNIKSVRLWRSRFDLVQNVTTARGRGRKHVLSDAAVKCATQLLVDGTAGGSRYVAKKLCALGYTEKPVAHTTITRAVKKRAELDGDPLLVVRGRGKKSLTQLTRSKRIAFATDNAQRNWRNVMITDRCRFYLRFPGTKMRRVRWRRKSQSGEGEAFRPNKPNCYNVYAGITKYGVTPMHPVTGTTSLKTDFQTKTGKKSRNITQDEYQHVLRETLLPAGNQIFGVQGVGNWVLQQDNDAAHNKAAKAIEDFNSQGTGTVELLKGWPGNSPDLSPIENVWAWVDAEVAALGCKNMTEFKEAVDRTFKNIPDIMLKNLFASLPKRMEQVLEREGRNTGY